MHPLPSARECTSMKLPTITSAVPWATKAVLSVGETVSKAKCSPGETAEVHRKSELWFHAGHKAQLCLCHPRLWEHDHVLCRAMMDKPGSTCPMVSTTTWQPGSEPPVELDITTLPTVGSGSVKKLSLRPRNCRTAIARAGSVRPDRLMLHHPTELRWVWRVMSRLGGNPPVSQQAQGQAVSIGNCSGRRRRSGLAAEVDVGDVAVPARGQVPCVHPGMGKEQDAHVFPPERGHIDWPTVHAAQLYQPQGCVQAPHGGGHDRIKVRMPQVDGRRKGHCCNVWADHIYCCASARVKQT